MGPADRVTLVRAGLTVAVAVAAVVALLQPAHDVGPWLVVPVATVALLLDRVDGEVARRTGTASAAGARFDMETDAALLAALSLYTAPEVGWWVLAIGAARYAFWLAQGLVPRLRHAAPPRPWCKVVAALQGFALVVAAAPVLPHWLDVLVLVAALALLVESFVHEGRDRWRAGGAPRRGRPGRPARPPRPRPVLTPASALLVWVCLLVPDQPAELAWSHWWRVPVEALVLALVLLVLPVRGARVAGVARGARGARVSRVMAAVAGAALALVVVHSVLDLGFRVAFAKPFDPLHDHAYAGGALALAEDTVGRWSARALAVVVVLAAVLLLVALPLAVRRVATALRGRRRTTLPVVAGLLTAWAVGAATGTDTTARVTAHEVSTHTAETVDRVRRDLAAERAFVRALADDPRGDVRPGFAALRGRDVLVVFVESYGRTALEHADRDHDEPVAAALARGQRRLARGGWLARSAWLTSSTYGGLSWLAHSTLHSGLRVDTEGRYDALLGSSRRTLARMMGEAGWRTVAVVPANREPWPEGERFYGWDRVYAGADLGYVGPAFGYGTVPDQFTLAALERLELGGVRSGTRPVLAEVDLVSSHTPWTPLPRMVPWRDLGDGTVFRPMAEEGPGTAELLADPVRLRAAYQQSVGYSLDAVTSFLAPRPADGRPTRAPVVVLVGDHQPARVTDPADPTSHDVPVTILTRDPELLARTAAWRWTPGLRPGPDSPTAPMESFRDRFVSAFG